GRATTRGRVRWGGRRAGGRPEGRRPRGGDGPAASRLLPQGVAFDPLPQLGPQDVAVYHVRVKAERAGNYRVRFDLLAEGMPQPVSGVAATRVVEGGGAVAAGRWRGCGALGKGFRWPVGGGGGRGRPPFRLQPPGPRRAPTR